MVEFNDLSRFLIDFPVFFNAGLIFNVFLIRPLNSSTFQACANPDVACRLFFQNLLFSKISFSNTFRVSNSLHTDQDNILILS